VPCAQLGRQGPQCVVGGFAKPSQQPVPLAYKSIGLR
jgi:hypothetical protein